MTLAGIRTGRITKPRRTLWYGVAGVGKSTNCAINGSIFVPTEEGTNDIDCHAFPVCVSYDEFIARLGELYTGEHSYNRVVIDSCDWLERLIWAKVCQLKNVASIEDIGYAKGFHFAITHWRTVLDGLEALRNDRGMTIDLIAHADIQKFHNPETDSYDRYSPRLHKLAAALITEWCDEVLFINYKVYTTKTDEGFNRKSVKGAGSGERVVYTTERPAHIAKNRLGLPPEMPFDLETFRSTFSKYLPNQT
jgi:hypothetical protein